MRRDPWTSDDPEPGDFDGDLAELDPRYIEHRVGDPDGKLMILVSVEGEDAELLRDADRSAA
jgi:hypothetical protein